MLNAVWKHILSFEGEPPVVKKCIPDLVRLELCRFLCALPLAQMNLRCSLLGGVTASDASEFGGGYCVSYKGLSPMGVHASSCAIRGDLPEIEDHIQVLTIGLFDGIGALRVCADSLMLPTMAGHISSEVSKEGNRGPPCQGVSRSSLFPHVQRVRGLCRQKVPWAQVHHLMESVASMDPRTGK